MLSCGLELTKKEYYEVAGTLIAYEKLSAYKISDTLWNKLIEAEKQIRD